MLGLISGFPAPNAQAVERFPAAWRGVARALPGVQAAVLAPFRFISDGCAISQRWTLFSTTGGIRYRLRVEARDAHSKHWRLLYRAQDAEHAFMRRELEYRRVRNGWNPNRRGIKPSYAPFSLWIARTILAQDAHFDRVRTRMERVQILARGAGIAWLGDYAFELEHGREVLP
ncbi:MAG: hypothetical protein ABJB12_07770 [Pseudomonadota bacterium]